MAHRVADGGDSVNVGGMAREASIDLSSDVR